MVFKIATCLHTISLSLPHHFVESRSVRASLSRKRLFFPVPAQPSFTKALVQKPSLDQISPSRSSPPHSPAYLALARHPSSLEEQLTKRLVKPMRSTEWLHNLQTCHPRGSRPLPPPVTPVSQDQPLSITIAFLIDGLGDPEKHQTQ